VPVYLASHALLRRKAAIKLLRADRITPDALGRFEREVQVTSTLTHPNTVAIYDYGRTDDGTFYYAMELLEGLDLHRLVKHTGPLSQARVLSLLRQACGSLAEGHAAGVVHRDVKPANLFVCTRGGVADTLKVLDSGRRPRPRSGGPSTARCSSTRASRPSPRLRSARSWSAPVSDEPLAILRRRGTTVCRTAERYRSCPSGMT
jgi:serine/threonine protein kinase